MDPFVGEIRIFAFNFAPKGWAFCDGRLIPIRQNPALFSILGTTYGGDGTITFGLPNLQGNAPINFGQGNGLSDYRLGEVGGVENVTLSLTEIPNHNHSLMASQDLADRRTIENQVLGAGNAIFANTTTPAGTMNLQALSTTGVGLPHSNMQPYLTLNFCISLQGVFPAHT